MPLSMERKTSPSFFFRCQSKLSEWRWRKETSDSWTNAACATFRYTSDWLSLKKLPAKLSVAYRHEYRTHSG